MKGHPLGPASLMLSPHQLWLASVSHDGLLQIRETACMVGAYFIVLILILLLFARVTVLLLFVVCVTMLLLHLQDQYIELQCHSYRLGGVRSVSFSTDSQTLLTAGVNDGSLVCANVR